MADDLSKTSWLLTGADGRIGRHLRAALAGRVGRIVASDVVEPAVLYERESWRRLDLTADFDLDVLAGLDGIVHLGGLADEAPFPELVNVNIMGTFRLLEAARAMGLSRFVYASSNRVTGFYAGTENLDDSVPPRPDGLYGVSKASCEALTRLYSDKFGLRVCNIRIGSFETSPRSDREAATWLSPGDATRAFTTGMRFDGKFATFYGVSNNSQRFWSLAPGHAVGYFPVDDASDWVGGDLKPPALEAQAGYMATPEFTLRNMEE